MIDAHSSVLGRTVEATEFDSFISSEKVRCRVGLSCRACRGPAYFTGRSRNGRAAYFGARHKDDCELEAAKSASGRKEALPEADRRAPSEIITIVAERRRGWGGVVDDSDAPDHKGSGKRHTGVGPTGESNPTRQIGTLLWKLMRGEVDTTGTVRLPDGTLGTIAEGTVRASDVFPQHAGKKRVYWGPITHVEVDDNGVWLSLNSTRTFKLRLRRDKVGDFLHELRLSAAEEFADYHVIFWDFVNAEQHNPDRLYSLPKSLELFAIRRNLAVSAGTGEAEGA